MTNWIDWKTMDGSVIAGRRVFIPGSSGEPTDFLDALKARPELVAGSEIVTSFIAGINMFDFATIEPSVRVTSFFPLPTAALDGPARMTVVPISYHEILEYIRSAGLDVAVLQVSPPDASGRCSLGPCVEFGVEAAVAAKCSIAVINENIRPGLGGAAIALSDFDYAVRTVRPILDIPTPSADQVSIKIASHVASLIEDGATIQTGIGKVPGQVLKALSQRRNLRIHSGIVLPGARDLVEGGVIEGVGTIVAASGAGDQAFYDWLEQSREVTLAEVSETHDLAKLIGIPKLTAINSAIEVDMLGQCNTEMVGGRYVSSAGGLPEFTIGAHKAKGGKSIIALPATDRKGKASRIVSRFAAGTPIAVPRHAVDFVVTEFGVADFRGKSAQARAEALIAIASPAFQADLASSYGSRDA